MNLKMPRYEEGLRNVVQNKFGGFDHSDSACDGAIYDMLNMTSDAYPILSTRKAREKLSDTVRIIDGISSLTSEWLVELGYDAEDYQLPEPAILGCYDVSDALLYLVCASALDRSFVPDTGLYALYIAQTEGGEVNVKKVCDCGYDPVTAVLAVAFNGMLIIWTGAYGIYKYSTGKTDRLDLKYDTTVFIEHDVNMQSTYINYIPRSEIELHEGDTVRLVIGDNDYYVKVLKLTADSSYGTTRYRIETYLNESIPLAEDDGTGIEDVDAYIYREIPALEHVCVTTDRIWGTVGNKIYCCASCDPYNWYDYDYSTVARAFFAEIPTVSRFTGVCTYHSDVFFFTDEGIYRMYGDTPDQFYIRALEAYGMAESECESFGIASGALFYNSKRGPALFDGESSSLISRPFGEHPPQNTVGAGLHNKYYMADGTRLYVYDAECGTWHKETGRAIRYIMTVRGRLLFFYSDDGTVYYHSHTEPLGEMERGQRSMVEFADITEGSIYHLTPAEFMLRTWLCHGTTLTMSISYDGGEYKKIWQSTDEGKHVHTVRLSPGTRAEYYRLKLEGDGAWKLYSLCRIYRHETNIRYGG